jgi:hypothetical protein
MRLRPTTFGSGGTEHYGLKCKAPMRFNALLKAPIVVRRVHATWAAGSLRYPSAPP